MAPGRFPALVTELTINTTMNRFTSLVLAGWCLFAGAATVWAAKPNVIVVMTDDQGYPELSIHGNPVVQTPHLDRLHDQGLRFTDYHHMSIGEKRPYGFEGLTKPVKRSDTAAVFTVPLDNGPMELHTWFQGKGTILSAYYVYVTRK
jgi:hypothetical protein